MSLFGEISEPSSRSTWEDWDDNVPQNAVDTLEWSIPRNIPDKIDGFYILEGQYLSDCIKEQSKISNVVSGDSVLYKLKSEDKYVCAIKKYNLLESTELIEILKPILIKSTNVLALITKPMSEYRSANITSQSYIARKLNTSIISDTFKDIKYKKLEQPNIITGVIAGALSLREHLNLPAMALVFYVEPPDSLCGIEEVNKQLRNLNIIQTVPKIHSSIYDSNLYI